MLWTRLWMGAVLVAMAVGMVVVDERLEPWYPFLLVTVLGLALPACFELLGLVNPQIRPRGWFCCLAVAGLLVANWSGPLAKTLGPASQSDSEPWPWILGVFAVVVLASFLLEMAVYRGTGNSVARMATAVWLASYLGLLPCFLVQLRWLDNSHTAGVALALAIFVPKCCDSGAYFTGRWLGNRRMTPLLSPKKTWEGAAGGLLASIAAAVAINRLGPVLRGFAAEIGFGITVGLAAQLGDLAESLIKRDSGQKDASQVIPGFGGILDIVDSVIFAAPVAYWWLKG